MGRKRGLPYGWWKDPDTVTGIAFVFLMTPLAWLLVLAWFLDWKPFW